MSVRSSPAAKCTRCNHDRRYHYRMNWATRRKVMGPCVYGACPCPGFTDNPVVGRNWQVVQAAKESSN